jgi:hypothetical protein
MYLGHSFLAFGIVATAGYRLEVDRRRVLVLGALAAGYGLLPDVDVLRTVYVFLRAGPEGVFPTEQHLWRHSWVVHRALTHSVVSGGVAAAVAALVVRTGGRGRPRVRLLTTGGIVVATAGLLAGAYASAGAPGVATLGLFLGGAVALAGVGRRRGATASDVGAAAALGLLTHPFGDFWMGRPPSFLWPVVAGAPLEEVALSADPVLHFVGAVAVEVALLAWCLYLLRLLYGRPTAAYLSPLALVGAGYAAVLGRVPAPTFAEAYQFSTGLFGLAVAVALLVWGLGRTEGRAARAFTSGVAAFGLGLAGYAAAYALAA